MLLEPMNDIIGFIKGLAIDHKTGHLLFTTNPNEFIAKECCLSVF